MAVIQDLPQELLDNIIELCHADVNESRDVKGHQPHLSLVAKAWVKAGQRALCRVYKVSPAGFLSRVKASFEAGQDRLCTERLDVIRHYGWVEPQTEDIVRRFKAYEISFRFTSVPWSELHATGERIRC